MTYNMKKYPKYFATIRVKKKKRQKNNNNKKNEQKRNRNMHEKVSPFVSKTLSKITTIIYIGTKISGFKNSCNEKKGFLLF